MERLFGEQWKALGIYDAIRLSSMDIILDKELLLAASCFWCSATNTMVLPLGPIGPTILDLTAILGTSPTGIPVDAALPGYPSNLNLKVLFNKRALKTLSSDGQTPSKEEVHKLHKNFFNYNTLYLHFVGRGEEALREGEHEAFLFYWYNKFICCTKSNKCLVENIPVAEALASGHTLALSPAILAHLLRCLAEVTLDKVDPQQNGPLWVFQLWLQVYFAPLRPTMADFSPEEALGPQLALRPIPPHQAEEVFRYFFALDDLSDDEFFICRRREYPSSIRLPTSAWGADKKADLRQSWGSFVLARDLPLGCEGRRASWEVYHPNFLARQLGYLQGCPVPLLSSRFVLSRGHETGSSEKECSDVKREFQERCQKFRLRPATPETLCTDTFGAWWEEYTQQFFGAPVETVLAKLFGGRPKKASAPQTQGSRSLKKVEVVAAAAAEKKSVASKKAKTAGPVLPSKRSRQEAEPTIELPRPAKQVKKLAKKGAREIHIISSHTTEATTPSVSPSLTVGQVEKQPTPTAKTVQVRPVSEVGAAVVAPSIGATPALERAVPATEKTSPAPPKPSVVVLEESEWSDKVPVASRPHPRHHPLPGSKVAISIGPSMADRGKRPVEEPVAATETPAPPQDQDVHPASEAAVPVGPSAADRGKRPVKEPEATAETPVHPQDQGFHIPLQEVTSAFASWEVEFKALISSIITGSGPSAPTTEAADSTALSQLREVLSFSASQVLEHNGLDLLGACLNDLGADGRLSGDAIVRASSALERVRETFSIFQTALKAEKDLQDATAVQDTLRLKIDA
ncbi:hypothetical protein TB2_037281 [Malus domestica]